MQRHGLAQGFQLAAGAKLEKVLAVDRHHLATGHGKIAEHIRAVLLAVADEVDGLDGFDVADLVLQQAIELLAGTRPHRAGGNAQQAFFVLRSRGQLAAAKGVLDGRAAVGKLHAVVVPALIGHRVGLVVQRRGETGADALHAAGLLQRRIAQGGVDLPLVFAVQPIGAQGAVEGVHVQLPPPQLAFELEPELPLFTALVHQQRLRHGRGGQQQVAVVAVGFLVAFGQLAALVGIVPIVATVGDLRRMALPARRPGALHVLMGGVMASAVVIQRPHQRRAAGARLVRGIGKGVQRLIWVVDAAHGGNGRDAVVVKGDRIEDALYNPHFPSRD